MVQAQATPEHQGEKSVRMQFRDEMPQSYFPLVRDENPVAPRFRPYQPRNTNRARKSSPYHMM
jgi:hypothetical protein